MDNNKIVVIWAGIYHKSIVSISFNVWHIGFTQEDLGKMKEGNLRYWHSKNRRKNYSQLIEEMFKIIFKYLQNVFPY